MAWNILKKDWKLLWPLVTALTAVDCLFAFARYSSGPFLNRVPTAPMSILQLLAAGIVIIIVSQQDPIPGTRQDWLVRPIARRDLFLAKLLFVVALVQGPWFLTDLLQGLANGFSWGESAGAAVACALWVLLTVSLPVLAFATLAASMTQTLVAAVGILAMVIVSLILASSAATPLTEYAWAPSLVRQVLVLAAGAGVLILQYRRRRTRVARVLFGAALLVGQCAEFLPWRAIWFLERSLTGGAGNNRGIAIAFAPGEGRFRPAPGQGIDDVTERPGVGAADVAEENQQRRAEGAITIFLPLRVSGLMPNSRLMADVAEATITGSDGRTVFKGTGNDFAVHGKDTDTTVHQGIRVPGAVYSRIKTEPLDLSLEYAFTFFQPGGAYTLPPRSGDRRMPGIGWCGTKLNDVENRVQFRCLQAGEPPSCVSLILEHVPTGRRNPEISLCAPDHPPYPGHIAPDALSRFGVTLPFYDPSGLVRYPVGGPELAESHVVVTAFRPTEHFVERVSIPAVRLQDWEAQPPAIADVSQSSSFN